MRRTFPFLLVAFISIQVNLGAEVPLLSKEELRTRATHIVVGSVQRIFSTTTERGNWRDTTFVAEIAVSKVEKGDRLQRGDVVYARYWSKQWTGRDVAEPHASGHSPPSQGATVRAHLAVKMGAYCVLLPNGFQELKEPPKSTKSLKAGGTTAANLQGTWDFVYYEEKGAEETAGTKQFVVKDNQLEFRSGGQTRVVTSIEVSGRRLDQKFGNGDVYRSLFLRAGDYWILCGNRNGPLPTEFTCGRKKGGEFFIVLKRE